MALSRILFLAVLIGLLAPHAGRSGVLNVSLFNSINLEVLSNGLESEQVGVGKIANWSLSVRWESDVPVSRFDVDDLDGDGSLEVLLLSHQNLLVTDGRNGKLKWRLDLGSIGREIISFLVIDDLDMDGVKDILLISPYCGMIYAVRLDGKLIWKFSLINDSGLYWDTCSSSPTYAVYSVSAEDLDGDGRRELLIYDHLSSSVVCLDPSGKLRWFFYPHRSVRTGKMPYYKSSEGAPEGGPQITADLDGDGKLETILTYYSNVYVLGENGDLEWHLDVGKEIVYVSTENLDGRGPLEIIIASDGKLHVAKYRKGIVWTSTIRRGCYIPCICSHDLDGDGYREVILACGDLLQVIDHKEGVIMSLKLKGLPYGRYHILTDLDKDENPEALVLTNEDRGNYLNVVEVGENGDGASYIELPSHDFIRYPPLTADVDGDGYDEILLVVPAGFDNSYLYVMNYSRGSIGVEWYLELHNSDFPLKLADVDGDGYIEILALKDSKLTVLDGIEAFLEVDTDHAITIKWALETSPLRDIPVSLEVVGESGNVIFRSNRTSGIISLDLHPGGYEAKILAGGREIKRIPFKVHLRPGSPSNLGRSSKRSPTLPTFLIPVILLLIGLWAVRIYLTRVRT